MWIMGDARLSELRGWGKRETRSVAGKEEVRSAFTSFNCGGAAIFWTVDSTAEVIVCRVRAVRVVSSCEIFACAQVQRSLLNYLPAEQPRGHRRRRPTDGH